METIQYLASVCPLTTSVEVSCCIFWETIESLPHNNVLVSKLIVSKLKEFLDNMVHAVQMNISVTESIEYIVGKGENAGYQHFLLFPQCFLKTLFQELLNPGIMG